MPGGGTVRFDLSGLEAQLRLYPKEMLAADVRTKNRTAAATRTDTVRRLRTDLPGLKAGVIRNQLKIKRATVDQPIAILEFTAKRFRLFGNFRTRQTKSGVSTGRLPWRLEALDGDRIPPQVLRHAFIQRARTSGVPNVWIRVGGNRYPITAIVVSSLATAYRDRGLGADVLRFARARYRRVYAQEMRFRIARRHGLVLPGA